MNVAELISGFVLLSKRQRYRELAQTSRGVAKLRAELAHFRHFDPACVLQIAPGDATGVGIARLLHARGASSRCAVFCEHAGRDAVDAPLRPTLEESIGAGLGTLIVCQARVLAYYEGESPGDRLILHHSRTGELLPKSR